MDNDFSQNEPVLDESAESSPVAEPVPTETASERKQDPWKTAFIVLVGIVALSVVLIYSTSSKRTEPTTVLQTDANGQPVQPLNPASGIEEERLAALPADAVNANVNVMPGTLPGGDGYDPWSKGGVPPPGGPPGGYVTVPPGGGSQFMPPECILQPSGIYLCPVPVNANTAVKPTSAPKTSSANANVQPSPSPAASPSSKATPTPTPATRPTRTPRPRASATPSDEAPLGSDQ